MRRWPWCALALTLAAGLLSSGCFGPGERFSLWRELCLAEPLRLWTGHLVHFNAAHLSGDLVAFAVWAALLERRSRRLLLGLVGIGAPLLSLLVLWLHPTLDEYRGLSALDCALAVALMLLHRHSQRAVSMLALTLFVGKCGYELATGHAVLALDLGEQVRLLPISHLLGALLGAGTVWAAGSILRLDGLTPTCDSGFLQACASRVFPWLPGSLGPASPNPAGQSRPRVTKAPSIR